MKPFSVGELRLLWRVERQTASSQSILKPDACRNHWLDKRAMRGRGVCVRVTGPVAGGDYVQVSRALTDIRRVQWESLTLARQRTGSQQGERVDRETVRDKERVREREETLQRAPCITTSKFFLSISGLFPETLVWTQGLTPCIIKDR